MKIIQAINTILGVSVWARESTWAFSSMIGRMKVVFNFLRDRVWKKVNCWAGKHLSNTERVKSGA